MQSVPYSTNLSSHFSRIYWSHITWSDKMGVEKEIKSYKQQERYFRWGFRQKKHMYRKVVPGGINCRGGFSNYEICVISTGWHLKLQIVSVISLELGLKWCIYECEWLQNLCWLACRVPWGAGNLGVGPVTEVLSPTALQHRGISTS